MIMTPLRTLAYRLAGRILFRRIGAGTRFFGSIRMARPFGDVTIGANNMIGAGVFFQVGRRSRIQVGDNCSINSFCHIVAGDSVTIGNNVAIAEFVSIRDQEHRFDPDCGVRGMGFEVAPIIIEDNVWIGRGVYIGPGSHIRRGSIVGANSVVRGQFPPASLIVGAPGKVKKTLSRADD